MVLVKLMRSILLAFPIPLHSLYRAGHLLNGLWVGLLHIYLLAGGKKGVFKPLVLVLLQCV